jgi:hypothetical protein
MYPLRTIRGWREDRDMLSVKDEWTALQIARSWGAPVPETPQARDAYTGWYTGWSLFAVPACFRRAIEAVEAEANWPVEVTEVLIGLVVRRDANLLRAWRRQALVEVGEATSEERTRAARAASAERYADRVIAALGRVADMVQERET